MPAFSFLDHCQYRSRKTLSRVCLLLFSDCCFVAFLSSYSSCPWGAASLQGDVVEQLLTVLGPVSGLERAALQLNSLRLDNAYGTRSTLVRTDFVSWFVSHVVGLAKKKVGLIGSHYRQAASSKFLLLLGSAHFVGSPITLVESIGTGFWDLW